MKWKITHNCFKTTFISWKKK